MLNAIFKLHSKPLILGCNFIWTVFFVLMWRAHTSILSKHFRNTLYVEDEVGRTLFWPKWAQQRCIMKWCVLLSVLIKRWPPLLGLFSFYDRQINDPDSAKPKHSEKNKNYCQSDHHKSQTEWVGIAWVMAQPFKHKNHLNNIYRSSPYRAVNTLLCYTNQSVNVV